MRITYVARSFLDYRVPVFTTLSELTRGQFQLIYSTKWSPDRVLRKVQSVLGDSAIPLAGEKSLGTNIPNAANTTVCLPFQPGLIRAIEATKPDVLVGDGFFKWSAACLAHRLLKGTPLVVCYERWAHTERRAQWYRKLYRRTAIRWVDAVCCSGRLCLDYTHSLGVPLERITTGHMAADTEELTSRTETQSAKKCASLRESWNLRGVALLYVGRLIECKGLSELLVCWGHIERAHPSRATLIVVGDGPDRLNLEKKTQQLELQNVRFIGRIDHDEIASYYASADAFIIPTLEDNWSLVVPEAMACGLPILCSKYNGCWPELVHEGRNGWVFDPLDVADTCRVLNACCAQSHKLGRMGRESQAIVAGHSAGHAAQAIYETCRIAVRRRCTDR